MKLGRVNRLLAIEKSLPALAGQALVLVVPERSGDPGRSLVALDLVGAEVGDLVLLSATDSTGAAERKRSFQPPWSLVAIVSEQTGDVGSGKPVPKKKPLPSSRSREAPQVETLDLFSSEFPVEDEARESRVGDADARLPDINDVDSIWNECDESEKGSPQ